MPSPEVAGRDGGEGLARGTLEVELAGPQESRLPCLAPAWGAVLAKATRGERAEAGPDSSLWFSEQVHIGPLELGEGLIWLPEAGLCGPQPTWGATSPALATLPL